MNPRPSPPNEIEMTKENPASEAEVPLVFEAPPAFFESAHMPWRCIMTGSESDIVLHSIRISPYRTGKASRRKPIEVRLPFSKSALRAWRYGQMQFGIFGFLGSILVVSGIWGGGIQAPIPVPFPWNWLLAVVGVGAVLWGLSRIVGHPEILTDGQLVQVAFPARAANTHADFVAALAAWDRQGRPRGEGVEDPAPRDPEEGWAGDERGSWDNAAPPKP